jgi:hypothetical protein
MDVSKNLKERLPTHIDPEIKHSTPSGYPDQEVAASPKTWVGKLQLNYTL